MHFFVASIVDYSNRFMGPIFFFTYIVVGVLIILNVVIAIIADAYIEAKEVMDRKVKEQEGSTSLAKEIALAVWEKAVRLPVLGPHIEKFFEVAKNKTKNVVAKASLKTALPLPGSSKIGPEAPPDENENG